MKTLAVEVAQRGQVTLPKALRDQYGIETGQQFTIVDLGGAFLFSPQVSRIDASCDQLRAGLVAEGATLEEMLSELRQRRESDDQT